ncbi:MAG TPA: hypothetical protein VN934_02880 [Candidatus Tumulicola sp.]|nr:hypothetical protein [Candidatus Tumulicola sp.]
MHDTETDALGEADVARGVQRHWAALRRGLERRIARAQAGAARRHPWPS